MELSRNFRGCLRCTRDNNHIVSRCDCDRSIDLLAKTSIESSSHTSQGDWILSPPVEIQRLIRVERTSFKLYCSSRPAAYHACRYSRIGNKERHTRQERCICLRSESSTPCSNHWI